MFLYWLLVVFLLGSVSVICVQCNCKHLGRCCCATLCPPVCCACLLYWWSIFSLPHAIAQGVMWLLWSVSLSVCHHANWWYRRSRSIYNSALDVNNGNRQCWDNPKKRSLLKRVLHLWAFQPWGSSSGSWTLFNRLHFLMLPNPKGLSQHHRDSAQSEIPTQWK